MTLAQPSPLVNATEPAERSDATDIEGAIALAQAPTKTRKLRCSTVDTSCRSLHAPTVQFATQIYFCAEQEKQVLLHVLRIGSSTDRSVVAYTTKDRTAFAGQQYRSSSGLLVFEPGETRKDIVVEVIDSPSWTATLEFLVQLQKENMVNACASSALWEARVRILDGDTFPSSKYKTNILRNNLKKISKVGLIIEYFKLNLQQPIVRRGTIKVVLLDLCANIYALMKMFIDVVIVDSVVAQGGKLEILADKKLTLISLMVLLVVPFAALHFLNIRKLTWKLGGASRSLLQKSLLRKFLNYTQESREKVQEGTLIMAVTRDVPNLVHEGYMNALSGARALGSLFVALLFMVTAPLIVDGSPSWVPLFLGIAFPIPLFTFLHSRHALATRVRENMHNKEDEIVDIVDSTVENYRLIADYRQRPPVIQAFESTVGSYNKARVASDIVMSNNIYFADWLTLLSTVVWTVYGGFRLIDCEGKADCSFSVGLFLGQIRSVKQCGFAWKNCYQLASGISASFASFERLVKLLNLEIDVERRMHLSRHSIRLTYDGTNGFQDPDAIPIRIGNLSLLGQKGAIEIPQGEFVSLFGPTRKGKGTLLRLIAGADLPPLPEYGVGEFSVPAHLRIIHIPQEPLFFNVSLLENLTFGTPTDSDAASMERVKAICKRFRVHESTLELLPSHEKLACHSQLSPTQRQLCHIIRGFVHNPQLLCLHKPLDMFDAPTANLLVDIFIDFVRNRGLEADPAKVSTRRVRTCIVTASRMRTIRASDRVFRVDDGIREVAKDDVTEEMLHYTQAEMQGQRDERVLATL